MTIKISVKLDTAIREIKNKLGEEYLFKIEWLMSHRNNKARDDHDLQNAIDQIVYYIKISDKERRRYFEAIINGYELMTPEDKVKDLFKSIYINVKNDESENSEWAAMQCKMIIYTLDALEVYIEGVNR